MFSGKVDITIDMTYPKIFRLLGILVLGRADCCDDTIRRYFEANEQVTYWCNRPTMSYNTTPSIGIGIPVYNGERHLAEAIESALHQSRPANEVLVFVHDSTDRSTAIARSFGDNVRVVESNDNLSMGAAWNAIYAESSCDYVLMLHADDVLLFNALQDLFDVVEKVPATDMVFGCARVVSVDRKLVSGLWGLNEPMIAGRAFAEKAVRGFFPSCSGLLAKRSCMLRLGFRPELEVMVDVEFFSRVGWQAEVVGIPAVIAEYRIHASSTLNTVGVSKTPSDLRRWWHLFESGEIDIPADVRTFYIAGLLKRLVSELLNMLANADLSATRDWLRFVNACLDCYPDLRRDKDAFTWRSGPIFDLANQGDWGIAAASMLLRARKLLQSQRHRIPV